MDTRHAATSAPNVGSFILYTVAVLTGVSVLFPPFTSLSGTEYAFVLTGPEWSHRLGPVGAELGLKARIHWAALGVQLAALWTLALGARWLVARPGA
jgi:hypothetical protein